MRLELDSNVRKLPWTFRPLETIIAIHPGEAEAGDVRDRQHDRPRDHRQAIPSYGPPGAAEYFQKLECFCFTRQTLKPGERRQMPVVFVIDPKLPQDLTAVTLA